ncbi:unnamed protein product [Macrosiphum euphorbiae]|uniref:Integrase catalytic domain-containing protein n=1 Tax=Macrosiphum euphorbiae TaxID=13131 RepID=A0AAV0XI35_9HEMI|nr:unnamed protein product [Macrosiphum euphorbiae]
MICHYILGAYVGPLTNTPRGYKHILVIIDEFTKFCWLFPTKSITSKEVQDKMNILQATFGNPTRMISDHGAAFKSGEFKNTVVIHTHIPCADYHRNAKEKWACLRGNEIE